MGDPPDMQRVIRVQFSPDGDATERRAAAVVRVCHQDKCDGAAVAIIEDDGCYVCTVRRGDVYVPTLWWCAEAVAAVRRIPDPSPSVRTQRLKDGLIGKSFESPDDIAYEIDRLDGGK